ncbi:hypothetical protein SH611_20920 [Geminicoccaceae bacterium 1502E]|nr:hypothetical protein [Geminicoccaceae bacterium 1502E]
MRTSFRTTLMLAAAAALLAGPAGLLRAESQKPPATEGTSGQRTMPEVPSTEHQREVLKKVPEAAEGEVDQSAGAAASGGEAAKKTGQQQPQTPKPKSN